MRFAKTIEKESCRRDAEMVQEIHKKWLAIDSDKNKELFDAAVNWFSKKHQVQWDDFLKVDDKKNEERSI